MTNLPAPRACMLLGSVCAVLLSRVLLAADFDNGTLRPDRLRCEYLAQPRGIDSLRPRLSWIVESSRRGEKPTAYRLLVASTPALLAGDRGDLWDSGRVESDRPIHVEYAGKPLRSQQPCHWKVRLWDRAGQPSPWSRPARWSMGLLRREDWKAKWIAGPAPAGDVLYLPRFRRSFRIARPVLSATLYITSLGYHTAWINGRRIGDHELDPVQSDFSRRVYYVTHDVTREVVTGTNALGVALGRGWYHKGIKGVTHDRPALLAQLLVVVADGTRTCIATDATWKTSTGPVSVPARCRNAGGDFGSECYDARLQQPGWETATFTDSDWSTAALVEVPPINLSAQMLQPNRVTTTYRPTHVERLADGAYLFDMGRNLTGSFQLTLRGKPGDEIKSTYFASHLGTGSPLRENFGQTDRYICRGGEREAFRSRFNYRAFRYVKVAGLSYRPRSEDATASLLCTDTPPAGAFECSNPMLNRLHRVVVHTHRCLTLGGIQVDCPHRERLGYGAEGQASSHQAIYNFDMAAFYTKWSRDFRDGQDPNSGLVHYTAPFRIHSGGGPAWSGACIVFPWQNYLYYGDRRILAEHYHSMCRWLEFLQSKTEDGILQPHGIRNDKPGRWEFLGDWASPRRKADTLPCNGHWTTPDENLRFNNFNYYLQLSLVAQTAEVLGHRADATLYAARAEALKKEVNRRFFDPRSGHYNPGSQQQALLALPLLLDLAATDDRPRVLNHLVDDITRVRAGHLDFGVLGGYYTLQALAAEGRSDLVYQMATQTSWPGWGHLIKSDATTLWEHWLPGDSSIHNSFLSIGGWFYAALAGIQPDPAGPGFQKIILRPSPVGDLTWVRAHYDSIRGTIGSHWSLTDGLFRFEATVPPGSTATVYLPTTNAAAVTEGGKPAGQAEGVTSLRAEQGTAVFRVESGCYRFAAPYDPSRHTQPNTPAR